MGGISTKGVSSGSASTTLSSSKPASPLNVMTANESPYHSAWTMTLATQGSSSQAAATPATSSSAASLTGKLLQVRLDQDDRAASSSTSSTENAAGTQAQSTQQDKLLRDKLIRDEQATAGPATPPPAAPSQETAAPTTADSSTAAGQSSQRDKLQRDKLVRDEKDVDRNSAASQGMYGQTFLSPMPPGTKELDAQTLKEVDKYKFMPKGEAVGVELNVGGAATFVAGEAGGGIIISSSPALPWYDNIAVMGHVATGLSGGNQPYMAELNKANVVTGKPAGMAGGGSADVVVMGNVADLHQLGGPGAQIGFQAYDGPGMYLNVLTSANPKDPNAPRGIAVGPGLGAGVEMHAEATSTVVVTLGDILRKFKER